MVIPSLSLPLMFEWPGALLSLQCIQALSALTAFLLSSQSELASQLSLSAIPHVSASA